MKNKIFAGFGLAELVFPNELFPVEGFQGVHDNPCIRIMILSDGENQFALVSADLVNISANGIEAGKNIIHEITNTPEEHIWIHATHAISTMHEPGPMGPPSQRRPETDRDRQQRKTYYSVLESAMKKAAEQAMASYSPAKIGWGSGECDANVNHDIETPFGWWTGFNPDRLSNKKMSVLRVEAIDGSVKGFFISYGIKPCALDNAGMEDQTRLVSADICGVCSRQMEARFGVPALFCVSAAGDQVPKQMALLDQVSADGQIQTLDYGAEYGLSIVSAIGELMGNTAVTVSEQIECRQTEASIQFETLSFTWKTRHPQQRRPLPPSEKEEPVPSGEREIEVSLCSLGDAAWIAVKPEINAFTEQELWKNSPFRHTCLICMVNGGMKYMPDREAYALNTFEAQSSLLFPGAAERFVTETVQKLQKLFEKEIPSMIRKPAADWSSKHNILILNKDGSLSPMDEPYYEVEKIAPGTWKILSSGDHSYLVEGEKEAISIDTGYGPGNIRAFLQTLTDKPVINTFNTHSHFDHSANNGYFDKAYMAEAGIPYASVPYASFSGIDFPQDYERVGIKEGFVYDLGGRTLEVFDIPDHTPDGIALLDRKERLLFTGDEFMEMGKPLHVSIHTFYGYLQKLEAHRSEFDRLCAGAKVFDASFLDSYYECARQILSGNEGEQMPSETGHGSAGRPKGPKQPAPGPNGELVYDRMNPHPGDRGPDFYPAATGYQPDRYSLTYAGVKIMYDHKKL